MRAFIISYQPSPPFFSFSTEQSPRSVLVHPVLYDPLYRIDGRMTVRQDGRMAGCQDGRNGGEY